MAERFATTPCPSKAGAGKIGVKKSNEKQASRRQQLPVMAITWETNVCSEGFGKPRAS
jgi:hypothetical protein